MDTNTPQTRSIDLTATGPRLSSTMTDWLDRWEPFRSFFDQRDAMVIPVEEYVEEGQLVIRAELPGIDPDEDISITVENNVLRIQAQRREERTEHDRHMYRTEMRYGAISRAIPLSVDTKAEAVSASYADGVLTVRLPVDDERAEARRIPVTRG